MVLDDSVLIAARRPEEVDKFSYYERCRLSRELVDHHR